MTIFGNLQNLKEENAYHYEIGYNRNFLDSLNLGVAVFYSDVKDKIQEVYIDKFNNQRKRFYQFQNVGDVDFYGAELNTTWFATNSLEIGANYTYINSDDGTDMDGHTVYMTDIPKHNFFAYLDWNFMPKWNFFISEEIQSKSLSDYDNKTGDKFYARGFGVTNFKLTYDPMENLQVDAGVNNIFDKYYEYSEGYVEDGRTFFVNLRYDF